MTPGENPDDTPHDRAIVALRAFNRFHTRLAGLLDASYMDSGLSLVEARALYEMMMRAPVLAADVQGALGLDPGYLSRIVARFERRGWIVRDRGRDGRQRPISMTQDGRNAFHALDARTRADVAASIAHLDAGGLQTLEQALDTVRALLGDRDLAPWQLRTLQPGDLSLIAARQIALYAREYDWRGTFENVAMDIVSAFARDRVPGREEGWVADRTGRVLGAVLLADAGHDNMAKLRLLHVEAEARGQGIGRALVDRALGFARDAGYAGVTLWTHAVLVPARHIYQQAGFALVESWQHDDFGPRETAEIWSLRF